jgi:hypothetical protein
MLNSTLIIVYLSKSHLLIVVFVIQLHCQRVVPPLLAQEVQIKTYGGLRKKFYFNPFQ